MKKRIFKTILFPILFLIAGVLFAVPKNVSASSSPAVFGKLPVKYGKYYYKVVPKKGIYRSPGKSNSYKKIVSTDGKLYWNQGYILTGNKIIYTKKEGKSQSVFQCDLHGKNRKRLKVFRGTAYVPQGFAAYYGGKLYFSVMDDPDLLGYCLDLKTKKSFQPGFIAFHQNGKFITCINVGVQFISISLLNASTGARKIFNNTAQSTAPTMIGKRIYYVQRMNSGQLIVRSCDFSGKQRRTEGTLRTKDAYLIDITKVTKSYCVVAGKKIRY